MGSIFIAALAKAGLLELIFQLTGREMFPARKPPRFLRPIYRAVGRAFQAAGQSLSELGRQEPTSPSLPAERPERKPPQ
jgi:hypothetical protein